MFIDTLRLYIYMYIMHFIGVLLDIMITHTVSMWYRYIALFNDCSEPGGYGTEDYCDVFDLLSSKQRNVAVMGCVIPYTYGVLSVLLMENYK